MDAATHTTAERQVTKGEFFVALFADQRDIMPSIVGRSPYVSHWKVVRTGAVWGRSVEGNHLTEATYFLRPGV